MSRLSPGRCGRGSWCSPCRSRWLPAWPSATATRGSKSRACETQSGLIVPERPARPIPREKVEEEARNAEAVVRQLTLPWASIIGNIEQAATREVAILQLQPDAESACCGLPPRRATARPCSTSCAAWARRRASPMCIWSATRCSARTRSARSSSRSRPPSGSSGEGPPRGAAAPSRGRGHRGRGRAARLRRVLRIHAGAARG